MSGGLQFDEETTRRVEALYQTPSVARRRQTVVNTMNLSKGEHVIDIGAGPGFLTSEIAEQTGPSGRVLGVDISDAMIAMATHRCEGKDWTEFQNASATELPAADESFDVAVSVQVYEYVAEVDEALTEMRRILKPGGRAYIVSTDWNSIAWNSSDRHLMKRVLADFEDHCKYRALPMTLASRMRRAGLRVINQDVIPQFEPLFDEGSYSVQVIPIIKQFVASRQNVSAEEADAWAADIHETGRSGNYFFCLNQYLFCAER